MMYRILRGAHLVNLIRRAKRHKFVINYVNQLIPNLMNVSNLY